MKKIVKYNYVILLVMGILGGACSDDDTVVSETQETAEPTEESKFATSGSVLTSVTDVNGSRTFFAGYFEDEIPENVDISQFNGFTRFIPYTVYKNYIFGEDANGANNVLNRFQINKETQQLEVTGSIFVEGVDPRRLKIINDELGFFTTSTEFSVFVFNPTTMEIIRKIELPNAKRVEENNLNVHNSIIYRAQDNKLFLTLNTRDTDAVPLYGATSVWVEVIDVDAMAWESTTVYENAQAPTTNGIEHSIVDEQGNIYITCQGSYGLDGKASINATQDSRPQIIKIPAGSTQFDPDYTFNPVAVNNPALAGNFAQILSGTIYGANGFAYAAISTEPDSPEVLALLQKFATGTITPSEISQLRNLVINNAGAKWARLNLEAKTVEIISGIPLTANFSYPISRSYDGKFYFNATNETTTNATYEYDPTTNSAKLLYTVTGGGIVNHYIQLSE